MAARDRSTITLRCPSCKREGKAEVSEADHPYMRSADFTFDRMPEGFTVTKEAEYRDSTRVRCECGAEFKP